MKRAIISIILVILLANIAFAADKHYELMLKYDYIKDKTEMKHIYVLGGGAGEIPDTGDYIFELRSFDDQVLESFSFHMSANRNLLTVKAPYHDNGKVINIYDNGNKKLLDVDVGYFSKVCGDGVCQDHESYGRCPEDCPSGEKDGYCDKLSDGKCDPDCITGDYDCESRKMSSFIISAIIALFLVIAILILLWKSKTVKKYERLLQLKHYIIANLRRGYKKDQIAEELEKDGWPKETISKAFRSIKPDHTSKEQLLELHNYIINTEKQGYTDEQIRNQLQKEGWTKEALDLAFKSVEKPKNIPKHEIIELQNYIMNTLGKGYTKEQILYVLEKEGWPEETLNKIFDRLKYSTFAKKK